MLRQQEHLPMNDRVDNVSSRTSPPLSSQSQWDRIARSEQFKDLLQIKKLFIIPAFIFFFAYYFGLAVLVGYAPKLASTRVIGTVTVAYLYALSQFVVGWIVAGLYLLASARFDALTKEIIARDGADVVMKIVVNKHDTQGDS
jgi:uncharacterized membrane protein (DUF485 family)